MTTSTSTPHAPRSPSPGGRDTEVVNRRTVSHGAGFWLVGYAFTTVMAFAALPTPLYVLYAGRDHLSPIVVTCVFAAYAIGVMASVFLLGHISDWAGRRRMLLAALVLSLISGAIFICRTDLAALLVARVISGVGVGIVTSTATAHIGELHARHRPSASARRGQVVAVAANLGGIGLGPLLSGLLAQFAPDPLRTPYLVSEALLLLGVVALALTPETVPVRRDVRYRMQRVTVPRTARPAFAAAAIGAAVTFTVFGVFSALVPSILHGTLHEPSELAAGAVAAAVFLASAVAQVSGRGHLAGPRVATSITVAGLALLTAATWVASFPLFVVATIVTGAGGGLVFKRLVAAVIDLAPAKSRGEALSAFFLSAYLGLVVPVIALGVLDQVASASTLMTVFAGAAALGLVISSRVVPAAPDEKRSS